MSKKKTIKVNKVKENSAHEGVVYLEDAYEVIIRNACLATEILQDMAFCMNCQNNGSK